MTKLNARKMSRMVLLLCAATAIAAPAQTFTTLLNFDVTDGAGPYYISLVQGEDGNFYGTTAGGGTNGLGTVFRITRAGLVTTLYNFCAQANCVDGKEPDAGLAQGTDGNFYGTTSSGGSSGWGSAFKITPQGTLTTLYSFCTQANCTDGATPYGGLTQATDGNFYGTTTGGGTTGHGTAFRLMTSGGLTTIHSFCAKLGACVDGSGPQGALIEATDGSLCGTTVSGGRDGQGVIFKISPRAVLTPLDLRYDNGASPWAGLVEGTGGIFYGTMYRGGRDGEGSVYKVTPTGELTTLHMFCGQGNCSDGSFPAAGLLQATDGNLYGTTAYGGDITCGAPSDGCGTVFQITPTGTLTTVHTFEGYDGYYPLGGLFQATNGILYGTTTAGGTDDAGTAFSLDMGLDPFVAFVRGAARVGQLFGILGQGFTGTTGVSLNSTPANFTVISDTYIRATVPAGANTGYVTVTTPSGTLTSNVPFQVIR